MNKIMTSQKLAQLRRNASPAKTAFDLSLELKLPENTIHYWLRKEKLPVRKRCKVPPGEDILREIRRLAAPDRSIAELARLVQLPYAQVRGWVIRLDLPCKRERLSKVSRSSLFKLLKQNKNLAEIGATLGLSNPLQIYQIVKKETGMTVKEFREKNGRPELTGYTPCMVKRKEIPVCREKRCHFNYKCESFREALRQGKVSLNRANDTHSSGGGSTVIHLETF